MTELVLPVAVLIAAVTTTYFFCLRPMRNGQGRHQPASPAEVDLDRALHEARQELERLRAAPGTGRGTSSRMDGLAHPRPHTSASE